MVPYLFAMALAAGCASTTVTSREGLVTERLPRPEHIWVYNFAATAADVPADSALVSQYAAGATPQTAEQIATGRQLGAQMRCSWLSRSAAWDCPQRGLERERYRASTTCDPGLSPVNQRGQYRRARRHRIWLRGVRVANGGRRLSDDGSWTAQTRTRHARCQGSKAPGEAVGIAGPIATGNRGGLIVSTGMKVYGEESGSSKVEGRAKQTAKEIADVLKQRFAQQGWIN